MSLTIRNERIGDFATVENLVRTAFVSAEHSNGDEHNLVDRLRKSSAYVASLALVAEVDGQVVGHILFTRIHIEGNNGVRHESLALAPVSVLPAFQKLGIGGALIRTGHSKACELGFDSVIVLGHPAYYPRFGFKPASQWGIVPPFDVPSEYFMALELSDLSLKNAAGKVVYSAAFQI